jgi:hypothetical protein
MKMLLLLLLLLHAGQSMHISSPQGPILPHIISPRHTPSRQLPWTGYENSRPMGAFPAWAWTQTASASPIPYTVGEREG